MRAMIPASILAAWLLTGGAVRAQDGEKTPAAPTADAREDKWFEELGSESYDTREAATEGLIKAGRKVLARVKRLHEETKDPEIRARTRFILEKLNAAPKAEEAPRDSIKDPADRPLPEGQRRPRAAPPGLQPGQGIPGIDELFKGMDMPEEFRKILEEGQKEMGKALQDMLREMLNPNAEREENLAPNRPRVRVWSNVPQRPQAPKEQAPKEQAEGVFRHHSGLRARPPAEELRAHVGLPLSDGGLILLDVAKGSWAEQAGLRRHDILVSIKGEGVTSLDDLDVVKKGAAELVVIRGGARQTLKLAKREDAAPAEEPRKDF